MLDKGQVVVSKGHMMDLEKTTRQRAAIFWVIKTIVLVDEGSASAMKFSGLARSKRSQRWSAKLCKGSVQDIVDLRDGACQVTIAAGTRLAARISANTVLLPMYL